MGKWLGNREKVVGKKERSSDEVVGSDGEVEGK